MTEKPITTVLDKGYVRLIDHMGSDLDVVNDARTSFQKEHEAFGLGDENLIRYLIRMNELSPFRGCVLKFELKLPFMVVEHFKKYSVASAWREDQFSWNEASRRYVTLEPEFYLPEAWRSAPENKKQGSGGPVHESVALDAKGSLNAAVQGGLASYNNLLSLGVAPEQARLVLPAYAMYTVYRWTASLNSVMLFLRERLGDGAQWEDRQYAVAIQTLAALKFPFVIKEWVEEKK